MKDIFGTALLDYFHGNYSGDIITSTSISEEDILPLPYLFRNFSEMPAIEQKALQLANGYVLDIGCGAGSHSLYLQEKGLDIMAIDLSPGAVEVAKLRGVQNASVTNVFDLKDIKFDTILMLMNGAGILGKLENVPARLEQLKKLLKPGGQILVDSSDLIYMYNSTKDGGVCVPGGHYYGELEYSIHYKGCKPESFEWLYIDEMLFKTITEESGFQFEIEERGENYDYLAKLSVLYNTPS